MNSYTANEKFHIAKDHLVEKALKKNGIKEKELMFSDEAIRDIIRFYTREAGVRGLERQIGAVCRKEAREILGRRKAKKTEEVKVTPESQSTGRKRSMRSRLSALSEDWPGPAWAGIRWKSRSI